MNIKHLKMNRWREWRLATFFRLLIWWGSERLREQWFQKNQPVPVEQKIEMDSGFPVCDFILSKNRSHCLLTVHDKHGFTIIELQPISFN